MKRSMSWLLAGLAATALAGGTLGIGGALSHGAKHNPTRFQYVQDNGVPSEYKGELDTLPMTRENLAAGAKLYEEHCALCHGADGTGGEAAAGLEPAPPALTGMFARPMVGEGERGPGAHLMHGVVHHHPGLTHAQAMGGVNLDAYTFWAISDGGEPVGSAMPAFKEVLSDTERWQIILYIANGFSADTHS